MIGKHGLGTKKSISDGLLNDGNLGCRPVGGPGRGLGIPLVWSDESLSSDGVFENTKCLGVYAILGRLDQLRVTDHHGWCMLLASSTKRLISIHDVTLPAM